MPFANVPVATTVLDSILFRDAFGTPHMRAVFSDHALIARYVEVEIALARAEARCGVIPTERGGRDRGEVRTPPHSTSTTCATRRRSSAIRSCRSCTRWRSSAAKPAATCTGAPPRRTSWTRPIVLQVRAALDLVAADIEELRAHPRRPRQALPRHADGGAHPPAAGPADHVRLQGRDLARDVRPPRRAPRATAGRESRSCEFAGAAGTLASLGDRGLDVQEALADELRPRRAGVDLARRARRLRRSGELPRRSSPAPSARSRTTSC